jgi:hypothetical protein
VNSTNHNGLVFPAGGSDGIFAFKLRVIDPKYRCPPARPPACPPARKPPPLLGLRWALAHSPARTPATAT